MNTDIDLEVMNKTIRNIETIDNVKFKIDEVWNAILSYDVFKKFNINLDTLATIVLVIVAGIIVAAVIKNLLRLGLRILMGVLIIVFVIFAAPKINTFLSNQIGRYGIIHSTLRNIVDGDIETKVKREYKIATGYEITDADTALLEELKAEAFKVDPNLSDEMNILLHCGFPQGVNNTLLLNFADYGSLTIHAETFADFVASFFIIRLTMLISYFIAFSVASKLFC
ncbi:MAG: hypothetical protein K6E10_04140 [Eubacterium sp.]|nr:hypothetical protein [Eubacterium sp.]